MQLQKHALVTGGAGFIGAHVAQHLLNQGMRVTVLDDLSGGYPDNIPSEASFVKASVTDTHTIDQIFENNRFNFVFHLAAYAAEGLSHFIRHFNYTNNLLGSVNLINASVRTKVFCFVFTSSIAVYGSGQVPLSEETTPLPEDPYGISKLAVEMDLRAAHELFGLDYIIFRPHNVYGELQNTGDPYRNVIGIFMSQLINGKPLSVFGDGSQTRAFSYIDDVAPHIARSINIPEARNQVFNIGADRPHSVIELAQKVSEALNIPAEINFLPERNEAKHAWADHSKAKKVFGITNPVPLDQGLSRMASWVNHNGIRKSKPFNNIELHKNLPPSWLE